MLKLRNFDVKIHTNYAAESWFNLLKNAEKMKRLWLPRFLKQEVQIVSGKT